MGISVSAHCQTGVSCTDLKNGIFYYYQKNAPDHYLIYRTADFQKEVNLRTGDTTLWKIEWRDKCRYALIFESSSNQKIIENAKVLKKHKLVYTISALTDDYYCYTGSVDAPSNPQIWNDTIWLKEKTIVPNSELFQPIAGENELTHLKDTSKYALLYLYRPGKITNGFGNYFVYFDNVLMCVARNSSGYIFKILKEGNFQLASRLYKDESQVDVDIRFGKTYYIKSMIHWGISSRLYNFKLEMAAVTPEQGRLEFDKIRNK